MLKIVTIFVLLVAVTLAVHDKFRVQFQWKYINVTWPSEDARLAALQSEEYIPENNAIAGIKLWKHRLYLTVPRWKNGVPVTLGVISDTPQKNVTAPNLEPYPNWQMQKVGNCKAFQFVQSMEIDPKGRMWVLDTGRTATMTLEAKARCTPRLVILDLEDNGKVLRSYEFPENVTSKESAYLNDIVLDHREGGIAYITDNGKENPGIIVYFLQNNTSWKFRHESTNAQPEITGFKVANTWVTESVHVDGIALSPASASNRLVYYTPLSSFHFYSIPSSVLINSTETAGDYVHELGRRTSQTDGIAMSATGVLYYGLIADDAIAVWDTKQSDALMQRVISRDHELTQWPDTFAFDEEGYLWCVTNSLQNFINNKINISVPNYRIIKSQDGGIKSYQYFENGTAPELPYITAGASRITFAFASCLAILLVSIIQ